MAPAERAATLSKNKKSSMKNGVHKKSDKKSELTPSAFKGKEPQDEFPNFFDMIKKTSAQKCKRQSFEVGQVVWVKFRRWSTWPSIILNVAKTKRSSRISIVFLPLKHFPTDKKAVGRICVNPKSVQPFNEFYDQNLISRNDKESLLLDFCSALHQAMLLTRLKINPFTDKLPDTFITDLPKPALQTEKTVDTVDVDSADSSEISCPPSVANNKKKNVDGETEKLVEMFESSDVLDFGRKILNDEFECERINSYKKKIKNGYFGFAIPREAVIFDDDQLDGVMEVLRVIIDQSAQASNMPFVFEVLLPEMIKFVFKKQGLSEEEAEKKLQFNNSIAEEEMLDFL